MPQRVNALPVVYLRIKTVVPILLPDTPIVVPKTGDVASRLGNLDEQEFIPLPIPAQLLPAQTELA